MHCGYNSRSYLCCEMLEYGSWLSTKPNVTILVVILVSCCFTSLYLLQCECDDSNAKKELQVLCHLYHLGVIEGLLCSQLCDQIEATLWNSKNQEIDFPTKTFTTYDWETGEGLVFKSLIVVEQLYRESPEAFIKATYPSRKILWIINDMLKSEKLLILKDGHETRPNINYTSSLNNDLVLVRQTESLLLTRAEYLTIWLNLQQTEFIRFLKSSGSVYITSKVQLRSLENKVDRPDYYPKIHGVCGSYYAVKRVSPLSKKVSFWPKKDLGQLSFYSLVLKWLNLCKVAWSLTNLAAKLDEARTESNSSAYHGCNIMTDYISVDDDYNLSLLNSADVISHQVMELIMKKQFCTSNEHCRFLHCRFYCNTTSQTCESSRMESHLQIFCRSIFPKLFSSMPAAFDTQVQAIFYSYSTGDYVAAKQNLREMIEQLERTLNGIEQDI